MSTKVWVALSSFLLLAMVTQISFSAIIASITMYNSGSISYGQDMTLHASGNKILRTDGSEVHLRGTNYGTFGDNTGPYGGTYSSMYAQYNTMFQKWTAFGFNTVRIMIIPDWWIRNWQGDYTSTTTNTNYAHFRDKMQAYIDAALNNNVYVVVSVWNPDYTTLAYNGVPNGTPVPSNTFPTWTDYANFWINFLASFANYSNIIVEFYNEPVYYGLVTTTFSALMSGFKQVAVAMRNAGYTNLVSIQYGYSNGFNTDPNGGNGTPTWFTSALSTFTGISNIIYSNHLYASLGCAGTTYDAAAMNNTLNNSYGLTTAVNANVPIYIGEIGCFLGGQSSPAWDTDAFEKLAYQTELNLLVSYGMGFTGFTWSPGTSGWALYTGTEANPTLNWAGTTLSNAI